VKNIIYILLLPLFIFPQNNNISSKKLIFSFESGAVIYSGNKLFEHRTFSREGLFFSFNFCAKKMITKKTNILSQVSFKLSNAIAKKIDVIIPETDIVFNTKIPNMLSGNLNYTIKINKKINNFLTHGPALDFRVFPLFYKKGQLLNTQLHSLGGFISSEENGSLPDLEKSLQISYQINCNLDNQMSICVSFFLNSDWTIHNFDLDPMYPGLSINFKKIINQNFQPPWLK
tara:strand:- start:181 stop:870 length:690 start_codon:yes stop_codon:yes gene_type:complete